MTEEQAIEAITARAITSLGTLQPTLPLAFENEGFDPASGPDQWARITIRMTSSRQVSTGPTGTRRFERKGVIFADLFGPLNTGRKPLAAIAADVRTTLESQELASDLWTYATAESDVSTDARWFKVQYATPFTFYETR